MADIRADSSYDFTASAIAQLEYTVELFVYNANKVKETFRELKELVKLSSLPH